MTKWQRNHFPSATIKRRPWTPFSIWTCYKEIAEAIYMKKGRETRPYPRFGGTFDLKHEPDFNYKWKKCVDYTKSNSDS